MRHNPLRRFADYAIDRGADRIADHLFERYGNDMATLITSVSASLMPSPKPPEHPPFTGLRSV